MEIIANIIASLREFLAQFGIILSAEVSLLDLFSLIAIPLGILYFPYRYINTHITSTQANRDSVLPWLENQGFASKYKSMVTKLSGALKQFYHEPDSLHAFVKSFSIAFAYPIVLFFLAYSFFSGSHEFSGQVVFPEAEEGRLQVFWSALLLLLVVMILMLRGDWLENTARKPFHSLFKQDKWQDYAYRFSMSVLSIPIVWTYNEDWKSTLLVAGIAYWAGIYSVVIAFSIVVSVVLFVGTGTGAGAGVGTGTLMGAVAFALSGTAAVAGAISFALAILLIVIFNNYTFSLLMLIFMIIYPVLNAFFDWLSLRVSRHFLIVVEEEESPFRILIDILLDLIIAVLFMISLVIVLPGVTEWFNSLYGLFSTEANIKWQSYAQDALDDPFGKGLMVTGMIITTLLPTLLHVFIGLFAFILNSLFGKQLARYLREVGDVSRKASFAAIWIEAYLFFTLFIIIAVYLLIKWVFDFPIGQWLFAIAQWGHNKPAVVLGILLTMMIFAFYNKEK